MVVVFADSTGKGLLKVKYSALVPMVVRLSAVKEAPLEVMKLSETEPEVVGSEMYDIVDMLPTKTSGADMDTEAVVDEQLTVNLIVSRSVVVTARLSKDSVVRESDSVAESISTVVALVL